MGKINSELVNKVFRADNYDRFNHWMSVVFSLSHSLTFEEWKECGHYPKLDPSLAKYNKPISIVVIPLIDFANHR